MSPEHARAKQMDERSDVYSFGCLMFETLTGTVPFVGTNVIETLNKHLREPAPSLQSRGVASSENLEIIVATCLQKDPSARFQSFDRIGDLLVLELEKLHE